MNKLLKLYQFLQSRIGFVILLILSSFCGILDLIYYPGLGKYIKFVFLYVIFFNLISALNHKRIKGKKIISNSVYAIFVLSVLTIFFVFHIVLYAKMWLF
jgi:hypothetical protein